MAQLKLPVCLLKIMGSSLWNKPYVWMYAIKTSKMCSVLTYATNKIFTLCSNNSNYVPICIFNRISSIVSNVTTLRSCHAVTISPFVYGHQAWFGRRGQKTDLVHTHNCFMPRLRSTPFHLSLFSHNDTTSNNFHDLFNENARITYTLIGTWTVRMHAQCAFVVHWHACNG